MRAAQAGVNEWIIDEEKINDDMINTVETRQEVREQTLREGD